MADPGNLIVEIYNNGINMNWDYGSSNNYQPWAEGKFDMKLGLVMSQKYN